jgi:hypothetical protein
MIGPIGALLTGLVKKSSRFIEMLGHDLIAVKDTQHAVFGNRTLKAHHHPVRTIGFDAIEDLENAQRVDRAPNLFDAKRHIVGGEVPAIVPPLFHPGWVGTPPVAARQSGCKAGVGLISLLFRLT